jgi:Protein of unknown function (DUF1580)
MPIIVTSEDLLPINGVPKFLEKRIGKRINLSTVYRWKTRGICGVRLETVSVGGGSFTTPDAMNEFFAKSTRAKQQREIADMRSKQESSTYAARQRRIDREAKDLGI